mmetsp:Transcript_14527/g.28737  ORF Transcript_14527/g.28737 Transcript_14527/m.28737 type:complete len:313 (+) Transcript_14527:236-1174(+)
MDLAGAPPTGSLPDEAVRAYTDSILLYILLTNLSSPILCSRRTSQRGAEMGIREVLQCVWNLLYMLVAGLALHVHYLDDGMGAWPFTAFWVFNVGLIAFCLWLRWPWFFVDVRPLTEDKRALIAPKIAVTALSFVPVLLMAGVNALSWLLIVDREPSTRSSLVYETSFLVASYGLLGVATTVILLSVDPLTALRRSGLVQLPCLMHLSWVVIQCEITGSPNCAVVPERLSARLAWVAALACYVWAAYKVEVYLQHNADIFTVSVTELLEREESAMVLCGLEASDNEASDEEQLGKPLLEEYHSEEAVVGGGF